MADIPHEEIGKEQEQIRKIMSTSPIETSIRDLVVSFRKKFGEEIPDKYQPLFKCLSTYCDPEEAMRIEEFEQQQIDRARIPAATKEFHRLTEKYLNKKLPVTRFYNQFCDRYPAVEYKKVHIYLKEHYGYSPEALRKYKERRIKRTGDFREELPVTKREIGKVERVFVQNDYRLTQEELEKWSGLDKTKLEFVLKKMRGQGKISDTRARDRKDGKERNVLVLLV